MSEEKPKNDAARNRKIVLISSGVLLFVGVYVLAFLLPDFITSLPGPQSMTLEQAAESATDSNTYAKIEDGEWNCASIEYIRGYSSTSKRIETKNTEAFVTDSTDKIAMLVTMSGEMDCDELEASDIAGYLTRMSESTQQSLTNDARLARFYEADTFLELCGYCGTDNSLIGTIFGIIFTLAGLGLLIFGWRMSTDKQKNS